MELRDQLDLILADLGSLLPEMILIAGSIVVVLFGLIFRQNRIIKGVYLIVLVICGFSLDPVSGSRFMGAIQSQEWTLIIKWIFLISSAILLLFPRWSNSTEFYFLILTVLVGSFFMLQSTHLLLIYISIELTSYGSYLLTALKSDQKASEASFKYLLFGGVSSAVMLYGISLWYGDSNSFYLAGWSMTLMGEAGVAMFLAGLLFKASIVPFHIWTPATYQAADTDAVAFFSVVPKLAAFVLIWNLFRILEIQLHHSLGQLLIVLALLTVLWGTFSAILQKNVKRLIAFGAIAHSGFLLPMVIIPTEEATNAFLYYGVIYAIMNYAIFYMIGQLERGFEFDLKLTDLNGLSRRNGFAGAMMVIILVSLIGLPPTAGFTAKLLLFSNVWEAHTHVDLPFWIIYLVLGVLSSVVSFFFYFRLPYHFFLKEAEDQSFKFTGITTIISTIFAVTLLYLFLNGNIFDNFKGMSQLIISGQ